MAVNLLIDLLWLCGMEYTSTSSIGKNGAVVIEYVQSIDFYGIKLSSDDIKDMGKQINDYLISRLKSGSYSVVLEKNDPKIQKIMGIM